MKYVPKPYQPLITNWIIDNKRLAIWSFMGSGKTSATLMALDSILLIEGGPMLVIAPKLPARDVWPGEVKKWDELKHLKVSPVLGDLHDRLRALATPADIYTVNFEQVPWIIKHFGDAWPFKTVVVDESSKLKGFRGSTQVSKTGKKFVRSGGTLRSGMLAKIAHTKVERFIELTGTPSPNGLKTLWGPQWFIDAGAALGNTFTSFTMRWFRQGYDGYTIEPLPHADKEIRERCQPTCFALKVDDWFKLDAPIVNDIYVDLPPHALKLYKNMEKEMYAEINRHGVTAVNAGAKSNKCSQMANGAVYVDEHRDQFEILHDVKLQALESIVEESVGMPILVAYNYKHDLKRLKKAFPHGRALDDKAQTVRDWNAGKIPLMFTHPASAGHGNNFQDGGNIIVYFGLDWDLELYMQILDRIGPVRQFQSGYNRPVFVHRILSRNTIDDLKLARLTSKRSVQDLLIEAAARQR